jgi:hypothetical protein
MDNEITNQLDQARIAMRDLRQFTDGLNAEQQRLLKECLADPVTAAERLALIESQLRAAKTVQSCLDGYAREAKSRISNQERFEARQRARQPVT